MGGSTASDKDHNSSDLWKRECFTIVMTNKALRDSVHFSRMQSDLQEHLNEYHSLHLVSLVVFVGDLLHDGTFILC